MTKPAGKVYHKILPVSFYMNKTPCFTQPPTPHTPDPHLYRMPTHSQLSLPSETDLDEVFRDRAVAFLRSISTGTIPSCNKSLLRPKTLQRVPGNTDANPVTSGVVKKSYQHCLQTTEFVAYPGRPWINLNEYPGRVIPSPIKDQLNIEFREAHPYLDPRLTLSQIVNLREDLITQVWKMGNFDPVILAIGFTCFDRLLNMNHINKTNRKLYASVCVLLAFKFSEETHLDEIKNSQKDLLDYLYRMDKHDLLTTKMIVENEFTVYSYLNFSMDLSYEEISNHLEYIKSRLNQEL